MGQTQSTTPGPSGRGISSTTIDRNGLMTITYTDGTNQKVQVPLGASGVGISNAVVDANGNLTITMSDGSTKGPFSIKGPAGIVSSETTTQISTQLTSNNSFVNSLATNIAANSNIGSNVASNIASNTAVTGLISSSLVNSAPFTNSVASALVNNATYQQKITGPAGSIANTTSVNNTFGWAQPPTITTDATQAQGNLKIYTGNSALNAGVGGSVKGMWCADGNTLWGDSNPSSICTIPSSNVNITNKWSGTTDQNIGSAEIANDTNTFKALVIVGNKSGDQKTSVVNINDNVNIGNILNVNGSATIGSVNINKNGIITGPGYSANNGVINASKYSFTGGPNISTDNTGNLVISVNGKNWTFHQNGTLYTSGDLNVLGNIQAVQGGIINTGKWSINGQNDLTIGAGANFGLYKFALNTSIGDGNSWVQRTNNLNKWS